MNRYHLRRIRYAALLAAHPHIDPMTVRAGEV
jgi:hypothetical protein